MTKTRIMYTCDICKHEVNPYADRWYTVIMTDHTVTKCVCETCNSSVPVGSRSLEMTDDYTIQQIFGPASA